jgi:hypothetical protein
LLQKYKKIKELKKIEKILNFSNLVFLKCLVFRYLVNAK